MKKGIKKTKPVAKKTKRMESLPLEVLDELKDLTKLEGVIVAYSRKGTGNGCLFMSGKMNELLNSLETIKDQLFSNTSKEVLVPNLKKLIDSLTKGE